LIGNITGKASIEISVDPYTNVDTISCIQFQVYSRKPPGYTQVRFKQKLRSDTIYGELWKNQLGGSEGVASIFYEK